MSTATKNSATHGDWSIHFHWTSDRWSHVVRHRDGGSESTFQSVEGDANDEAPPSPVFQELQLEHPEPGVTEFQAFGRCGKTVCSAAIRISDSGVLFDVCTRNQSAAVPTCRSSTYDLSTAPARSSTSRRENPAVSPPDSKFLADEVDSRCAAPGIVCEKRSNSGLRYSLAAQGPQIAQQNRTVRWRYRIAVEEA